MKMPHKKTAKRVGSSFDDIGGSLPPAPTAEELSKMDRGMRYMPGTMKTKSEKPVANPKPKIIPIQDRMTGMNTRRRRGAEAMGR